jgi:hypothetical protein
MLREVFNKNKILFFSICPTQPQKWWIIQNKSSICLGNYSLHTNTSIRTEFNPIKIIVNPHSKVPSLHLKCGEIEETNNSLSSIAIFNINKLLSI